MVPYFSVSVSGNAWYLTPHTNFCLLRNSNFSCFLVNQLSSCCYFIVLGLSLFILLLLHTQQNMQKTPTYLHTHTTLSQFFNNRLAASSTKNKNITKNSTAWRINGWTNIYQACFLECVSIPICIYTQQQCVFELSRELKTGGL